MSTWGVRHPRGHNKYSGEFPSRDGRGVSDSRSGACVRVEGVPGEGSLPRARRGHCTPVGHTLRSGVSVMPTHGPCASKFAACDLADLLFGSF